MVDLAHMLYLVASVLIIVLINVQSVDPQWLFGKTIHGNLKKVV